MFRVQGKRAIVTGGASGIGRAIVELFAAQKAEVVLVDLDPARAETAAQEIAAGTAGSVSSAACDVSDEAAVRSVFAGISGAGPIDILVNCAGIAHVGNLGNTSAADLDRLYRVNVRGTYLCMQSVLAPMLTQQGGVILNMASIAATAGLSDRFAYSMTKGAVLAMTLSVARDYIAHGIRCNCISPARVHTPFVDGFLARNYPGKEAEQMAKLAASQPIGRMGQPAEVAAMALYLCSDAAGFVTGVDYPIDGGFLNLR
jgi:NAD(P)-dependent dehydrogenase (short-subunit alcohol dehydrogenase family)